MSDKRIQVRQGDLLFTPINAQNLIGCPRESFNAVDGKYILAEGEKTGHVHTVPADLIEEFFYKVDHRDMSPIYLTVIEDTEVTHDEHSPAPLLAGSYIMKRQERYVPKKNPRPVID